MISIPCLICVPHTQWRDAESLAQHLGKAHPMAARVLVMAIGFSDLTLERQGECSKLMTTEIFQERGEPRGEGG